MSLEVKISKLTPPLDDFWQVAEWASAKEAETALCHLAALSGSGIASRVRRRRRFFVASNVR